jgi:hypothetical protein
MCNRPLRGCTQYKRLTVIRDALTLATCSDKGKPVERRGRKATGLKELLPMTAGLPRSRDWRDARTPISSGNSSCHGWPVYVSVRGSFYDTNA